MMIQGRVVMSEELGVTWKSWMGPGEEVAPRAMALTRSRTPRLFQSQSRIVARPLLLLREINQASGRAVTPMKMSPQPAAGANRGRRRPAVMRARRK